MNKNQDKKKLIDPCAFLMKSCINFKNMNELIIQLVNDHYFDLQMYANFVFDIDNSSKELSVNNNFYEHIRNVKKKYDPLYPYMPLFTFSNMTKLEQLVITILKKIKENIISSDTYLSDIENIVFFGCGDASSSILLKIFKKISDNKLMPLIVKFIPFHFPHHYDFMALTDDEKNKFITRYIESPGYALYIKEAWMYCFTKNELEKYTPTFICVSNCYIIRGFPIRDKNILSKIYAPYVEKKKKANKNAPYKKWLDYLIDPSKNTNIQNKIIKGNYGCFEMKQIQGTLKDLYKIPGSFNLSIVFEYLYTKIVAAYIGRIIFTDDHFGNIAYDTVEYTRLYKIKCNGFLHFFYMPPGKMVQFIDLERYVFNFSQYDIYTNTALQRIPDNDFIKKNEHFEQIKKSYQGNNYIFDKSLKILLDKSFNKNLFSEPNEYEIMIKILKSPFIHDIKSFCQIMESNLPITYFFPPSETDIHEFFLNLDDESIRVIDYKMIEKQI